MYTYKYVYICIPTCVNIYIYMYIYIHIYIRAVIDAPSPMTREAVCLKSQLATNITAKNDY